MESSKTKKCIVLDLDNTLWGGIIGEDGFEGIHLGLSHPGSSFIAFQQVLLDLVGRGIILAINSRNNEEEAMRVIREHPNMILKENHFAGMRINWNDKADNIIELAKEINIGLDSMVFLDDDPTNRSWVKERLPEVEVPELPSDPTEYARFLLSLPYFPEEATTDEDKMRSNLYVTERLRKEAEKEFSDKSQFLKNLGLELIVNFNDDQSVARLSQLTEKTNQFNVNKNPLSEKDILSIINNPGLSLIHGKVSDKFGDYGITIMAIVEHIPVDKRWHIKQLLMSCRVIGRGVEDAFIKTLAEKATENGIDSISIEFNSTEKNKPAEEFVQRVFKNDKVSVKDITSLPTFVTTRYGKIQ